jgi:hypothetical protein
MWIIPNWHNRLSVNSGSKGLFRSIIQFLNKFHANSCHIAPQVPFPMNNFTNSLLASIIAEDNASAW